MSLILADRVRETAAAPGTGAVSLLGAVTGFQSFSVIGDGNTCHYCISDQSGANWEIGLGTYSTTGPTLTRTTVYTSSNSNNLVNFSSGTQDVFLTYPSSAAVTKDGTETLTNKTLINPNISALTSTDTFFTFNLAATTPGFSGGFVFNQGEEQSASITNAIYEGIGQANFALIRPSTGVDSFVEFLAVGLGSVQFTQTGSYTSNFKILTRDFEGGYYTNAQFDSENNTLFQNLLLKNETQNTIRLNSIVANEGAKEAGDIEFYADNTGRSITTFFVQDPSRIPMLSFDSTGVYTYNNLNLISPASNTVSITSNVFADSQTFDAGRIEFFYLNDGAYRSQTRFYTRNESNVEEHTAFFDYHGLNLQNRSIREAFLISSQVKFAVNYLGAETAEFDLSLISADTHRTYTLPDQNGTIALTSDIESPLFQQETLSGATDDENTIFTLSQTPKTNSQFIFKNGLFQTLVNDYTLSEVTVTFVVPPKVGDQLTAVYQY